MRTITKIIRYLGRKPKNRREYQRVWYELREIDMEYLKQKRHLEYLRYKEQL